MAEKECIHMEFLNNMKKCKLFRKQGRNKGLTVVEMLAASAILSLLSLILYTGIFMAQESYNKITSEAETQLLLSTISDTLSNELRYARDVVDDRGVLQRYTSMSYGKNTTISISDEGQLLAKEKLMLSSGAYGNGDYQITDLEILFDTGGIFHVSVSVESKTGAVAETKFDIGCLNES